MNNNIGIPKKWITDNLLNIKQYAHDWYEPGVIHEKISSVLSNDKITRFLISVSPQFGKTELACRTFPACFLAKNPNKNIVIITYSQTHANALSVKCRDFFLSDKFQELFPLKLHPEMSTKYEWSLASPYRGSAVFSGKGVTGKPADMILVDDIFATYEDALSPAQQEEAFNWYLNVLLPRLQSEKSRVGVIMSRYVKRDLIGRIIEMEKEKNTPKEKRYYKLNIKPIINCKVKGDRSTGESSWPQKKSMEFLLDAYKNSPSTFVSLWEGNPRDSEALIIDPSWFKKISNSELKTYGKRLYSVRGWDFGYTVGGNCTAGVRIDVFENNRPVIIDVIMFRATPKDTRLKVIEVAKDDGEETIIGVESGGTQIAMADSIVDSEELYNHEVVKVNAVKSKIQRAMPWIIRVNDGKFVILIAPWNDKLLSEAEDFSEKSENDNQIDAISVGWQVLYGKRGRRNDEEEKDKKGGEKNEE